MYGLGSAVGAAAGGALTDLYGLACCILGPMSIAIGFCRCDDLAARSVVGQNRGYSVGEDQGD